MQTSITQFQDAYSNGLPYGSYPHKINSFTSEEVGSIPLGYALVRGTDPDNQVLLPSAAFTAADFLGFAVNPNTREKLITDATGTVSWATSEQVPVAVEGVYTIKCRTAFVAGTAAYVQHTLAAGINPGELRGTNDAVNSSVINARFVNSGAIDDIAIIELYIAN